MLSRRLEHKGFSVTVAENGNQAIELMRQRPFDLVLLDVLMPGLSGLEVLRELRQSHPATELPVIMATGLTDSGDVVEALQLGANDYVSKPLDFPVVLARIQAQLSLKGAVEETLRLERSLEQRNLELIGTNARLAEANRRMERDLRAAARIQEAFLPRGEPRLPRARFAWHYRPCEELAGDGLNAFALDERHAALYVFDVSGHGVASALLSVTLSRVLSPPSDPTSVLGPGETARNGKPTRPAEVAARLNRMFPFDETTEQYFTILYGVLDAESGAFHYISAGHPGIVHVPAEGPARIVDTRGFPIGLVDLPYEEHVLPMAPGDRIFLYSDGIPEAMDAGGRVFGSDQMLAALETARHEPIDGALGRLLDQLARWTGSVGLRDDISLVGVAFGD